VSSFIYNTAATELMTSNRDLSSGNYAVAVVTSDYAPDPTHVHRADLVDANVVALSGHLTGLAVTTGVWGADDITLTAVSGGVIAYLVIYEDNGSESSDKLICCIEFGTGLPYTPSGGDIEIVWDSVGGIFSL
jgi:hypothetical protein